MAVLAGLVCMAVEHYGLPALDGRLANRGRRRARREGGGAPDDADASRRGFDLARTALRAAVGAVAGALLGYGLALGLMLATGRFVERCVPDVLDPTACLSQPSASQPTATGARILVWAAVAGAVVGAVASVLDERSRRRQPA
jgi:hypothetical protein